MAKGAAARRLRLLRFVEMPRRCRLVCIGGLTIALAGLATDPVTAAVASVADRLTLERAPQASIVFDVHDQPVFSLEYRPFR